MERGVILENLKFYDSKDNLVADVGNGVIQKTEFYPCLVKFNLLEIWIKLRSGNYASVEI